MMCDEEVSGVGDDAQGEAAVVGYERHVWHLVRSSLLVLACYLFWCVLYCGVSIYDLYVSRHGIVQPSTYLEQRSVFIFVNVYAALVWSVCVYECTFILM